MSEAKFLKITEHGAGAHVEFEINGETVTIGVNRGGAEGKAAAQASADAQALLGAPVPVRKPAAPKATKPSHE